MTTEEGIVVEAGAGIAWVKTEKSGDCASCAAAGSCIPFGGGNHVKTEVINTVGAAPGDRVVLSFSSSSLLKAAFFLYMFPILCLIAGAIAGMMIAPLLAIDEQVLSAVVGFSSLLGAIVIIRVRGDNMSQKDEYRPQIIRILKRR